MEEVKVEQPIEEVMFGVRKEKLLVEYQKARDEFKAVLKETYGEVDSSKKFVDDKLALYGKDEEWNRLFEADWGDSLSAARDVMEREKVMIEESANEPLKKVHSSWRKMLVAQMKIVTVSGADWGMWHDAESENGDQEIRDKRDHGGWGGEATMDQDEIDANYPPESN